ncbi:MAG: VTT domain-containing protein [Chlamydiales bacterium]|nr:VTT domain-containing protein [Chlamydiales bacterium]
MKNLLKKYSPLIIIIVGITLFYLFHLHHYFTFDVFKSHHRYLKTFVHNHVFISVIIAIIIYIVSIALSLPIAGVLSLAIGYLFVFPLSTFMVVFSATIGACILFVSTKIALSEHVYKISPKLVDKIHHQLETKGSIYLVAIRLLPIIPFWVINIVCAMLNISFARFLWTTVIGIIPGSILYTYAGDSLNTIFEKKGSFSISEIFTPHIQIAFGMLITFILLSLIIKKTSAKT